ncbi:RICIN domain-containing protein [Dactylosporangium sp. NPDC005555]|uniref:RICIN domain-containing protein n=1 Tax=Dactylosporangium sp. NPDC005555 TaxID=3154889 RepID=UPI0033A45F4C
MRSLIPRPNRLLLAAAALVLAAAGLSAPSSAAVPGDGAPSFKMPADDAARGLVYGGFKAGTGRCAGLLEVKAVPGACTHGPDAPFQGLDVKQSVAPLSGLAVNPLSVVCDGDGVSGNRVQVLYVRGSGNADRYNQYLASIRTWSSQVDDIYSASAAQTGGTRHVRYVTDSGCNIAVSNVAIANSALSDFGNSVNAIKALGYNRTDRKYLMYVDATALCGVAYVTLDDRPGQDNANNSGASFSRVDSGCWSAGPAAHELTHAMGAVMGSSPNHTAYGHCTDDYDIMCYNDGPGTVMRIVCADQAQDNRLDCNKNDYFHTNPPAGSYLATHWNTANNRFLIAGGGGGGTGGPLTLVGVGKCVDVNAGATANGTKVQIWSCNGTGAQQWTLPGDGTVRALGKCLDVSASGTANGTKVQLWDCNGTGAQQWTYVSGSQALRNPQSGRCLDDPAASTTDGTQMQIWDCNASNAQRVTLP